MPAVDWPAVKRGYKTEFRVMGGDRRLPQLSNVPTPALVVGYTLRHTGEHDHALLILERSWQEPLGAISERSLAAEGVADLAEFRRYWMNREHRRFTPTRNVIVCRVRPAADSDLEQAASDTFTHLYGEFLE